MNHYRSSFVAKLASLLLFIAAIPAMVAAQADTPRLQVFIQLEGSPPDWQQMDLSVARMDVGGLDPVSGKRFNVTAFSGLQSVSIPRSAEGSPRLLVAGPARVLLVDRVLVSLSSASLMTEPPNDSGSPKIVPISVQDNALKLRPLVPFALAAGDVISIVAKIRIGKDALLTTSNVVALHPSLAVELFVPTPENYLDPGEVLFNGPPAVFTYIDRRALRAKALDESTGDVRDVVTDERTGARVSFSELRSSNETAWRDAHGALTPALVHRLEALGDTDTVSADVWANVPGAAPFHTDASTPGERDADYATHLAAQRTLAQPVLDGLASTLQSAGATVESIELTPPVLHVRASRAVLEDVAAGLPGVILVKPTVTEPGDVLATNAATDLVQAPLQFAHLILPSTRDLRIALAEPQACINESHEVFQGVNFEAPITPCSSEGPAAKSGHSTAVAGALAAFVPEAANPQRRPPPGLVGLFQGRIFTNDFCGVRETLLERKPNFINLSCAIGSTDASSEELDYAVFDKRIFVANGSGNIESGEDGTNLPAYCYAYNSVCVGGYGMLGTHGPGNFADDYPIGRWVNDPLTGREKPDLVAPAGGYLPSYEINDEYDIFGGTSFSTPFVVGTAALLVANFQPELLEDPTLTRAVLMASAFHSFSGLPSVPSYSDGVDDKTGAGAPRGDRADEIMTGDQYFSREINRTADFGSDGYLKNFISFNAQAGDRVRIVMTYDQCQVNTIAAVDKLQADLDMIVLGDGKSQANNSHVDNTEIQEFTSTTQSSFTVKVKAQFWDPCSNGERATNLAIAWDTIHSYEQ